MGLKRKYFKRVLIFFLFLLLSFLLVSRFFLDLAPNEFLLMGDQYIRFNYYSAFTESVFIRRLIDLGVHNGWQIPIQIVDTVYYMFMYKVGFSIQSVEKIQFFLFSFISLSVSYFAFKKIFKLFNVRTHPLSLLSVVFWYCFNPYVLELWHGGAYNFGALITYTFTPLIFYHFHLIISREYNLKRTIILSFLLFLSSLTFWIFAPIVFFLIIYTILYVFYRPKNLRKVLHNCFMLMLFYIPLSSVVIYSISFPYVNMLGYENDAFRPTFSSQQGGIWYQLLMYFSWGIYTVWHPRHLYSFGDYFFSMWYIIPTLLLYGLIVYAFYKNIKEINKINEYIKKNSLVVGILIMFFVSLFFAKGAQPPFGFIFKFMYHNIPFFSVFRTADIRFGFLIVLCIALLLVYASSYIKKYIFGFLVVGILFFQSAPLFSGVALRGQDVENKYFDRIVSVSKDHKEVIEYINSQRGFFYVLLFPEVNYGHFKINKSEDFVGQDLLTKFLQKPYAHFTSGSSVSSKAYDKYKQVIEKSSAESIKEFPFRYLVVRRDVVCKSCEKLSKEFLINFELALNNELFDVYLIEDSVGIVELDEGEYKYINPTKFLVNIDRLNDSQQLKFNLSFDKNWKLYALPINKEPLFTELLFSKTVFDSNHTVYNDFANSWIIEKHHFTNNLGNEYYEINKDGSINVRLAIVYRPQLLLYATFGISLFTSIILIVLYIKEVSKKND